MRVLFDTSPLKTGSSIRGIGTYTRELLRAMEKIADVQSDFSIVTSENEADFDLIHYPFFDLFFSTLPSKKNQPVVVTVHDVIPLVFPDNYKPGIRGAFNFWRQKRKIQRVNAVITDSECSKKDIGKYLDIPDTKIFPIALAASDKLQPPTEYAQAKYKEIYSLPNKYVVYVGDINFNKNIPTLLLALTLLPEDIHLVVVSATFSNQQIPEGREIAAIIAQNNLKDKVHVLSIAKDDTAALSAVLSQSKCLVQPSLYEGFGLPVLEAMQVGAVVVSSNGGSLPEVVGEAGILVEPTIQGILSGLNQAIHLRGEEKEKWVTSGLSQAKKFSWEKTALETISVYRSII